jgi:hypothetical protein
LPQRDYNLASGLNLFRNCLPRRPRAFFDGA